LAKGKEYLFWREGYSQKRRLGGKVKRGQREGKKHLWKVRTSVPRRSKYGKKGGVKGDQRKGTGFSRRISIEWGVIS